ncbi:hypothetical protein [Azospirillum griseum]|uniref:hypothetical protein n=1 Tax=Azospirillum griseum TaxID=2496639 RepID=UPI00366DF5C1
MLWHLMDSHHSVRVLCFNGGSRVCLGHPAGVEKGLESDMRRKREVVEGQIYRKVGPSGGFWQVVAIRKDAMGTRHAQLMRTDDPKTLKTLSVAAILDNQQFEIAADSP